MKRIHFKEPLLDSIIMGYKTQTRRIVKPQNISEIHNENTTAMQLKTTDGMLITPRYQLFETLYIPEPYLPGKHGVIYKYGNFEYGIEKGWKNKLFMPERYARYFIEITGVRCERLQDISDDDCLKEGVMESDQRGVFFTNIVQYTGAMAGICNPFRSPREAFAALLDEISGIGTWNSNPFVWVYEFKLIDNKSNNYKQIKYNENN